MFHATAKALNAAAEGRGNADGVLLTAQVQDIDIQSIIAGASAPAAAGSVEIVSTDIGAIDIERVSAQLTEQRDDAFVSGDALRVLHEEFRWAESKLMQASERLAEAQEMRRKDLVALAIMRRELRGSFAAERRWVGLACQWFGELMPLLHDRERELDSLVSSGVHTAAVIHELAAVRAERKLFALAIAQSQAQIARIDESESAMEYDVASEAYDREPDGATMRELARLRSASSRLRRDSVRLRNEATAALDELGVIRTMGEVTAANAFLAAEHEGDSRAAERMDRVRAAQVDRELTELPTPSSAWKAGLLHPVHFIRARKTTR